MEQVFASSSSKLVIDRHNWQILRQAGQELTKKIHQSMTRIRQEKEEYSG
jgi:hypothetical protein